MNVNRIRDRAAGAVVSVLRRLNRVVQYQHRGGTPVTVYADWSAEGTASGEVLHADTVERARTFFIPRQNGFPPDAGVAPNDLIIADNREYRVLSSDDGGLGALYQIEAQFVRAWRLGAAQ
jgi:hypothetical protein